MLKTATKEIKSFYNPVDYPQEIAETPLLEKQKMDLESTQAVQDFQKQGGTVEVLKFRMPK